MKFAVSTRKVNLRDNVDEQACDIIKGIVPAYIKYLKYKWSGIYDSVTISRWPK